MRALRSAKGGSLASGILALIAALALGACLDVRELEGDWRGPRVGEAPVLRQGFPDVAEARLRIEHVDLRSLRARLTIEGDVLRDALIQPIPGAEADALADLSFDGAPARVYLAFADTVDGGGPALVVVALYTGARVELRVMRGGAAPLYGVFVLTPAP